MALKTKDQHFPCQSLFIAYTRLSVRWPMNKLHAGHLFVIAFIRERDSRSSTRHYRHNS